MYTKRTVIKGVAISSGIALGKTRIVMPGRKHVPEIPIPISGVSKEEQALDRAVELTISELRDHRNSAGDDATGPVAKVFDAQLLIAGDYEFIKQVKEQIAATRRNAAFVYNELVAATTKPLKSSSDEYMQHMALDVESVAMRVLSYLMGNMDRCDLKFPPNTILVGKSFSPAEILDYRHRNAVGFVVSRGGSNTHMALIARSLLLPVVMTSNRELAQIANQSRLIVDGNDGSLIVEPSTNDWTDHQKKRKRESRARLTRIRKLTQIPPLTRDGQAVPVASNLTLPGPVDNLLADQMIPVGLYRSEFLYLEHQGFPDEEVQYQHYRRIVKTFKSSSVTLRTFDLGYDKMISDDDWPEENNPALGWRGIRIMLDETAIFKTQIRAILRASTSGNVKILLPMITDLSEFEKARRLIAQVKFALTKEGIPFANDVPIGIMIEVPSAAMTADKLAQRADFLSIGSNDLTQYTVAADRLNYRVSHLYNHYHPSVLNLIRMVVEAGHRHSTPVSICGEMAGEILALPLFIGMRVDAISMNPARIFDVCRMVKKIDAGLVAPLVSSVMSSGSLQSAVRKLQRYRKAMENAKH